MYSTSVEFGPLWNVTLAAVVKLLGASPGIVIVNAVEEAFATVKLPTIFVSLPLFVIATVSPLVNKFIPTSLLIVNVVVLLLVKFAVVYGPTVIALTI